MPLISSDGFRELNNKSLLNRWVKNSWAWERMTEIGCMKILIISGDCIQEPERHKRTFEYIRKQTLQKMWCERCGRWLKDEGQWLVYLMPCDLRLGVVTQAKRRMIQRCQKGVRQKNTYASYLPRKNRGMEEKVAVIWESCGGSCGFKSQISVKANREGNLKREVEICRKLIGIS